MKKGKKRWLTVVLLAAAIAAAQAGILPVEVLLPVAEEVLLGPADASLNRSFG